MEFGLKGVIPVYSLLALLECSFCFGAELISDAGRASGAQQSVLVILIYVYMASLVAQLVKTLPAMRETWVQSLGREDPLEKEMATHSSILA